MGPDEILRRCVLEHEKPLILAEAPLWPQQAVTMQESNSAEDLTTGLWWPTLHKDAREYCHSWTSVRGQANHLGGMKFP